MPVPSKDPCKFFKVIEKEKLRDDPCSGGPEYDAFYQCSMSLVHDDLTPRKGQCLAPTEPAKAKDIL